VRTGERHEVSEKVCMRKAGMPNPESSDGDFVTYGRVDWKKTREEGNLSIDQPDAFPELEF